MRGLTRIGGFIAAQVLLSLALAPAAEKTALFNGKNLDGWTFHAQDDDSVKIEDPWIVKQGMLISQGLASGFLIHDGQFEDYVLTFEIRTMSTEEGNGVAVGSLGSVFVNASAEEGAFREPKSVEISLRDVGNVFFRDIDRDSLFDSDTWVHRAPDFADDVDRDMGEWNRVKFICHGERLTVIMNSRTVNQVEPVHPTKGSVALKSSRGFFPAPTFYRNIVVKPIGPADLQAEQKALAEFTKIRAAIAQQKAAEDARQAEEQRLQAEAEQELAKQWAGVQVNSNADFQADVRRLPYPADARNLEFRPVFDMLEFESPSSLAALSKFYSTEMANRGWQVTETDVDDDEVTVTFVQGEAEVELNLDESSDGVDVSIDCDGLSFEGTDNPAELVKLGLPQPKPYLVLQREFKLPESYQDHEYDSGESRSFKSTLSLPDLYEFLTQQLRQKGYSETRRPIISDDRRYSEFAKAGVEISVNAFAHEIGSRVILTYEVD